MPSPSQGVDMGPARTPQFDPKASAVPLFPYDRDQFSHDRDSDFGRRAPFNHNDAERKTPQILARPFSADDENSRNESYRLDRGFRVASP